MFDKPLVVIDFETTGLNPNFGDRVTEVAAVRITNGKIADRFVSLINCNVRIPAFITQLTGITQSMVDNAPPVSSVMPKLMHFIGIDVLSAHNASFDAKFLIAENQKLGITMPKQLLCSLMLSRRIFPGLPSYKLTKLSEHLGINFTSRAHRAEADAEVTAQLLLHIASHLCDNYHLNSVSPHILSEINQLTTAKVSGFLSNKFANTAVTDTV